MTKVNNEWLPVVKIGRTIPFGYREDDEDPGILQPIPEELELLEMAKTLMKEYSYRNVAQWLSEKSGRYISHIGLKNRVAREEKWRQQAGSFRRLERKWKAYAEKAEKLEARYGSVTKRPDRYNEASTRKRLAARD